VTKIVVGGMATLNQKLGEIIAPSTLDESIRLSTAQNSHRMKTDGALIPAEITISLDFRTAGIRAKGHSRRVGAAAVVGPAICWFLAPRTV
jgi:hypothetical protein